MAGLFDWIDDLINGGNKEQNSKSSQSKAKGGGGVKSNSNSQSSASTQAAASATTNANWGGGGSRDGGTWGGGSGGSRSGEGSYSGGGNRNESNSWSMIQPPQNFPMKDMITEKYINPVKEENSLDKLNQERIDWSKELNLDGGNYQTRALSYEEYTALTPQQKAAVDANTAIVQAVNEDKADFEASGRAATGDKEYEASVEGMFGKGGGSDTYAPRTLAVLNELGIGGKGGPGDLDNYLDLRGLVTDLDLSAITPENVQAFNTGKGAVPEDARAQNALAFSAQATKSLSERLQAGQSLLDAARTNQATPGAAILGDATAAIGFNPGLNERDARLNQFFDVLAQRDNAAVTPEVIASTINDFNEVYQLDENSIRNYFETRLKAADYGSAAGSPVSIGYDPALNYYSPDEFRSLYYKGGQ